MESVTRFSVNLGHSVSIWVLVSRSDSPHGHATGSWGWNLPPYSPIGAWFRIVLMALAHRVIEWLKRDSHVPPFAYVGWNSLCLFILVVISILEGRLFLVQLKWMPWRFVYHGVQNDEMESIKCSQSSNQWTWVYVKLLHDSTRCSQAARRHLLLFCSVFVSSIWLVSYIY